MYLPPSLEPYRQKIESTRQDFIRVAPQEKHAAKPWESKIGGLPYLPKNMEYPSAADGAPLFLLAQINFSELPPLPPFPKQGILQFFIADDDLYGMDFDEDGEQQDNFRVRYFDQVITDLSQLHNPLPLVREYDCLPHRPELEFSLAFSLESEFLPHTDYRFEQVFGADFFLQFGEQDWEVVQDITNAFRPQGHKIGGYGYFLQEDPRRPDDPMIQLLQLDSDEMMDLMWGDMGIGHFFIRESDLAKRDFTRVLYDWDGL